MMDSFQVEERLKESLERAASKLLEKSDQGLIDFEDALEVLKEAAIEAYNQALAFVDEKAEEGGMTVIVDELFDMQEAYKKAERERREHEERIRKMLYDAVKEAGLPINAHSLGPFEVKVTTYDDPPLK